MMSDNLKVLVCQLGARRRYAVPRLLEEAGMLQALYTDFTVYSVFGRAPMGLGRLGVRFAMRYGLSFRVPEGIPREKVFTSNHSFLPMRLKGRRTLDMGSVCSRWGLQGAEVVYSMYGEGSVFLQWAKTQGAKIIVDVFVHPFTNCIVAEESEYFIEGFERDVAKIEGENRHSIRTFEAADILLCPSSWVADGVRAVNPKYEEKIRIVPYGSSLEPSKTINYEPVVGRVLFAGRDPLRKGLHYLAEAAALLRADGHPIEVRAAGVEEYDIGWIEHRSEIQCLGNLSKEQMYEEFGCADLFVLPSLSEGQAGVILEAMACGCPVVATRESGVDFHEGCGVFIPACNATRLAAVLRDIIWTRERRDKLAEGALRQSWEFSAEEWKRRLVAVIHEAVEAV